jgi:Ca2+-dependent lipid-binding protein
VRGESLVAMDASTGSSDPYFKLKLKTQKWKSPVARQTLNPTYDAAVAFFVAPEDLLVPGIVLKLECWDEDIVGKDFMGEAEVPLRRVVARALRALGAEVFERVELRGVQSGAAHFKFRFQPVDVEAFRETEDGSGGDEGGEAFEVEETPATPK